MRVAVVHDWLVVNGGAEKVLKEIINCFSTDIELDVFSIVDFLNKSDRDELIRGKKVKTTFIQKLPFAKRYFRNYLPLFPLAIERLDLSKYDLIISSSYAVAKGIIKSKNQLHICYCHTPIRYAWDLENEYLNELKGFKKVIAKIVLGYIRKWDLKSTNRVDFFIANSLNISERIKRIYNRDSIVIYPPVNLEKFTGNIIKSDYYFTSSRLVSYKKVDLIIRTFNELPHLKLVVSGDGPEQKKLQLIANKNISFVGYLKENELINYMQKAKAFILAANEDFGITSIEAQSCYTPVIAYKKGGYLETIIENKTGMFFSDQSTECMKETILIFEKKNIDFKQEEFEKNVSRFSEKTFQKHFKELIEKNV